MTEEDSSLLLRAIVRIWRIRDYSRFYQSKLKSKLEKVRSDAAVHLDGLRKRKNSPNQPDFGVMQAVVNGKIY